jgi:hypothetical protein
MTRRSRLAALASFVVWAAAGCASKRPEKTEAPPGPPTAAAAGELFRDPFSEYPDGLITNEFAHWNPGDGRAKDSALWELTSGSLFAQGGAGWSGVPDDGAPDPASASGNDSCVFRMTTTRADFGDVAVELELLNQGLLTSKRTPQVDWDGVHVFLRYQTEYNLYYASVNRRDNHVVIKKKIPGGPSNGGTYYNIGSEGRYDVPYGAWQAVRATVRNRPDGSVLIELYADGKRVVSATDDGAVGGPPITHAGKVGIRADNANIKIKNFVVTAL